MASTSDVVSQSLEKRNKNVESLYPRMRKMAGYYARCSNLDAEDLFQEACVGLLRGLVDLDPEIGTSDQYLLKRARWHVLDTLKKRHSKPLLSLEETDSMSVTDRCLLHDHVEAQEFLAQLTSFQRSIVSDLLEGFTWREIGKRLACSSPNVAYHVRDIRRRLAGWLDRSDGFGLKN